MNRSVCRYSPDYAVLRPGYIGHCAAPQRRRCRSCVVVEGVGKGVGKGVGRGVGKGVGRGVGMGVSVGVRR